MTTQEYTAKLQQIYVDTVKNEPDKSISTISMQALCNQFQEFPDWCIGPIQKDHSLTFKKTTQWNDPTGIGWKAGFLFNPSTIVHDGKLYLFYRAAPKKESLSSRIGLAIYDEKNEWTDYAENPIIFPQTEDEVVSTEDPKIYRLEDGYILFYNGIGEVTADKELLPINAAGDFPFTQLAVNKGGTLSWGGLARFKGSICYAQGWDAKSGDEELYFYTAPIQR